MGKLNQLPPSRLREYPGKGVKEFNRQGMGKNYCKMLSSGHVMAIMELSAQDLHKNKRVNTAWLKGF